MIKIGVFLAGLALVASPAHASCLQETTEALVGLQQQSGAKNPGPDYIRQAIKSDPNGAAQLAENILRELSPACQDLAPKNVLAYASLGQPAEPAAKPASAPQPTASQSGGGAMLDAEIAELRRQRDAGGASPEVLARLTALEARLAVRATGPDLRPQIDRLERQLSGLRTRPAATLSAADRKLLQLLPEQIAAMRQAQVATEKAAASTQENATTAIGAATTATTASAASANSAGRSEAGADRSETAATWLEAHQWMNWVAFVAALIALVVVAGFIIWWKNFRKKDELLLTGPDLTGPVREEQLNAKADASTVTALSERVDQIGALLDDTRDQIGAKNVSIPTDLLPRVAQLEEGGEFTTAVVVGDTSSEHDIFEVVIRKGADGEVFITSGVKGHTVTNAVKISNLVAMLKNAAFNNRLNKKAGA